MSANLRERRRALRGSLKALPYGAYLKAMLVLMEGLRRLYAGRQDELMSSLVEEAIGQLRCVVTPGCEPAPEALEGLYARFEAEFTAKMGRAAIGPVVFWQTVHALLFELAEKTGPYEASQTVSSALYYRFADLGTATFGLANPNLILDDDDPTIVEFDRFDEAIRRVAAGEEPDQVYAVVFG